MSGHDTRFTSPEPGPAADAACATEAARWLLDAAAKDGLPLTQTFALARTIVREAVERWPDWWDTRIHGLPNREADLSLLEDLHAGLRRLRLLRRRGRKLHATVRGRELAGDPPGLLRALASDLGRGDAFTESVARIVVATLAVDAPLGYDELTAAAFPRLHAEGWQTGHGVRLTERAASWAVGDVVGRGVAYGIIDRQTAPTEPRAYRSLITLTRAGAVALGLPMAGLTGVEVLVFDARLVRVRAEDVRGVRARLGVASYQHLTALHEVIIAAFGCDDDHLYSFWLDGRFWGDSDTEYSRPHMPDTEGREADVPLAELGLEAGARIAYVFDYGDEWRVELTLRERQDGDGGRYPRILARGGTAPLQYPPLEDE
jgi:hypothetical protein